MRCQQLLIVMLLLTPLSAFAWSLFGYDSREECQLEELKECGGSKVCANAAYSYCAKEFPYKTPKVVAPKTGWFKEGKDFKWWLDGNYIIIKNLGVAYIDNVDVFFHYGDTCKFKKWRGDNVFALEGKKKTILTYGETTKIELVNPKGRPLCVWVAAGYFGS